MNMRTMGLWASVSACALAGLGATGTAQAQGAASASDKATTTVQEVVVTAERRSTSLQKTAISATVLTGKDLEKKNINTIDGLQFSTPALTVQDTGENVLVNIRGIGKSFGGIQDPSGVLIYRDGVSASPGGFVADEPYYDLAGVEVLRGPQGTLAGENATAGALFIRENDPVLGRLNGYVQGQYGNYDDALLRGAVNIPLGDDFAVRFATNDEHRDSFYHLTGPWTGNPGKRTEADQRVSFLWRPNQALTVTLKNDYLYIDHGGSPAGPASAGTAHLFDLTSDAHLEGLEQGERSVLQVNYKLDNGMSVRSISGFQWYRTAYDLDLDGTSATAPGGGGPLIYTVRGTDRTVSEEINILSPDRGPFRWVLGGVYQNELVDIPSEGFVQSAAAGGTVKSGLATAIGYKTPKQDWGFFGQGTYDFNRVFQLQVGARYSEARMRLTDDLKLLANGSPLIDHPIANQPERDSRLTGKIGLNVHLSDVSLLYAFVATGYKSGGVNPLAALAAPSGTKAPAFSPEDVTDYEIGWKTSFFDRRLKLQLDGFYDDYKDYQVGIFDTGTGLTQLRNVPGASTNEGVEGQLQADFGDLSFDANLAYLSTSLGTFSAIDSRNPGLGDQVLTDRQLPNAPHWTASAGVQYRFHPAGEDTLTPRVDWGLTGARWGTVFDVSPIDHLPSQSLFNAQLAWDHGDKWEVAAYATNLFDLKYISSLSLGSLAQAGAPRQFGVRVSRSF